jgi:hypothetical protein
MSYLADLYPSLHILGLSSMIAARILRWMMNLCQLRSSMTLWLASLLLQNSENWQHKKYTVTEKSWNTVPTGQLTVVMCEPCTTETCSLCCWGNACGTAAYLTCQTHQQTVQSTGRVASMDYITAQLKDGVHVGASIRTGRERHWGTPATGLQMA